MWAKRVSTMYIMFPYKGQHYELTTCEFKDIYLEKTSRGIKTKSRRNIPPNRCGGWQSSHIPLLAKVNRTTFSKCELYVPNKVLVGDMLPSCLYNTLENNMWRTVLSTPNNR